MGNFYGYYLGKDLYRFILWAFDGNVPIHNDHVLEKWNKIHGDLITLKPNGNIGEDAKKMIELWRKHVMPEDITKYEVCVNGSIVNIEGIKIDLKYDMHGLYFTEQDEEIAVFTTWEYFRLVKKGLS